LIRCRLRRGDLFFASPGKWLLASGHGEAAKRYQVQIDGSGVSCHDEIVSVKSKKQGTRASADSANDAVPVAETVRVPQHFINGTEIKSIDVGIEYKSVLALAKALN
jgi:hypothetical protein